MKDLKLPFSKEKKIALGFTVAVHVVAISGLLFLGLAQPYEPPKSIKTVLIKPEDLIIPPEPTPLVETDSAKTAHTEVQPTTQQTADPVVAAPNIPTTAAPPVEQPKVDTQKAAEAAKQAAAEQQAALMAAKATEKPIVKLLKN